MMAEDRTARPVSGEIMTDPAAEPERIMHDVTADVIDADYEVLPRHFTRPDFAPPPARKISTPSIEGMDILRKPETAVERPLGVHGGPIFWIAGVGAAFAAFWISGGHALVR